MSTRVQYSQRASGARYRRELLEGVLFRGLVRANSSPERKNLAVFSRDPVGLAITAMGVFEGEILEFVLGYLKQRGLVRGIALDVGANVGNHSVFFSRYYEAVESFEPHPVTFQLLSLNARLASGIHPHNFGASDTDEVLEIYNEAQSLGGASFHPHHNDTALERYSVVVRPLDSVPHLAGSKIGLLKVDVEGHELKVLKGATGIIRREKPVILFEQHPVDFDSSGRSAVVQYLRSLSYSSFAVVSRSPSAVAGRGPAAFVGRAVSAVRRLVFGYEMNLRIVEELSPGFHPAILALP
jgi:FkbM family methyltransferase